VTRDEVVAALEARGYTHAVTAGGPVPLGRWVPYQHRGWVGDLRERDGEVEVVDRPGSKPYGTNAVLGVWSFAKQAAS
jgi:hypothetical protein